MTLACNGSFVNGLQLEKFLETRIDTGEEDIMLCVVEGVTAVHRTCDGHRIFI